MRGLKSFLSLFASDRQVTYPEEEKFYLSGTAFPEEIYELSAFVYKGELELYKLITEEKIGYYTSKDKMKNAINEFIFVREEYNSGVFPKEEEHTLYFVATKLKLNTGNHFTSTQHLYTSEGELYGIIDSEDEVSTREFKFKKGDIVQFIAAEKLQVGIITSRHPWNNGEYLLSTEDSCYSIHGCKLFPLSIELEPLHFAKLQGLWSQSKETA